MASQGDGSAATSFTPAGAAGPTAKIQQSKDNADVAVMFPVHNDTVTSSSTLNTSASLKKTIVGNPDDLTLVETPTRGGDLQRRPCEMEGYHDLPRLKGFGLWHRKWSNLAYAIFILMCNVALPCVLYYILKDKTSLSEHALLGIASATLGVSSSFDNPFRMWKLYKHRDLYGPLNDNGPWWHFDWTMHLYSVSLLIFAWPLAIGPTVKPILYNFFLMSAPMLVACPGIYFFVTLFGFRLPFQMSSDVKGTPIKPGVFYLFEDIGAVDFRHGKPYRRALNERYNASPVYRDLMWYETLFWAYGCALYFGASAAVCWTTPFDFAFGFILGFLFIWMLLWAVLSVILAEYFHRKEDRWLEVRRKDPEVARWLTREGAYDERRKSVQVERERRRSAKEAALSAVDNEKAKADISNQAHRIAGTTPDQTERPQAA